MNAIRLPVVQGTSEWLDARRTGITSTDIAPLLGVDPWRCEADVAAEKTTGERPEPDEATARRFRLGHVLEQAVRSEDEIEHGIRLRRVSQLLRHPDIPWALTSLDFERVGERCIVEAKTTASRSRFADGLPAEIECQVRWQMGVAGYPRAHVAVLRSGQELECFDVKHDPTVFDDLVMVATDFRKRLAEGGPFAESNDSLKRRWPSDNGAQMVADEAMGSDVRALVGIRRQVRDLRALEEAHEARIKTRMGDLATAIGEGYRVSWKKSRDREETDYRGLAESLMGSTPEPERAALVGPFVTVRQGARYFRVTMQEEE